MITSIPLKALDVDGRALGFVTALLTVSTNTGSWTVDIESLDKRSYIRQGAIYPLRLVAGEGIVLIGQAQFTDYTADLIPLITFTGVLELKPESLVSPQRADFSVDRPASA